MFDFLNLKQRRLGSIALDPLYGRVLFDFLSAFFVSGTTYLLMQYNLLDALMVGLTYAGLIELIFWFLGLYRIFKTNTPLTKTVLIGMGILLAAEIMWLWGMERNFVVLSSLYVWLILSLPRWFLSFNRNFDKYSAAYQIAHDTDPILVVGGGGYIGSHVVTQLLEKDYPVRVFDTFYYGKSVFNDLKSSNLDIQTGDVTDIYALTKAMQNVKGIVHLAGIVGDPACSLDDQLTLHVNMTTTRMIRESAKGMGIPRFIFASSCSVYGASSEIVNEQSKLNPVSLYAQTKIDAERELLSDSYDEFHPTILRFATVFGHSRRMRFDLVANLFTAQAYENGLITVKGSGQWRPFVHVSDIARSIVKTLEAPLPKVSRQIFNVGDDDLNTTIGELAKLVAGVVRNNKAGRKVRVLVDDTIDDRRNYHVSFDKIQRVLGFRAKTHLGAGAEEMHTYLKNKTYSLPYTNEVYSNVEMTKLIQKEFKSEEYQKSHFSLLNSLNARVSRA